MRTCLDCEHCKVRLPIKRLGGPLVAKLLYDEAYLICEKKQWKTKPKFITYKDKVTKRETTLKSRLAKTKTLLKAQNCQFYSEVNCDDS